MSKEDWKIDWESLRSRSNDKRTHENEVLAIIHEYYHRNSSGGLEDIFHVFVDCGPGIIGSEAWSIRDFLPKCEIIGIEPQVDRYGLLLDGGYPGTLHNSCVSSISGKIDGFMGHPDGKSDFWLRTHQHHLEACAYKPCSIDSVTIDELLHNSTDRAFVWADIEGSEYDMLQGAQKSLEMNKIVGFFLEIHKETSPDFVPGQGSLEQIDKFLEKYNFSKKMFRDVGTHQDWLYYKNV